ncbi:MAG: sulfatase [Candidatus Nealsonbacteria bacterium]|nr:sulfatase [Candidatus Nealsonbacteria bacterium]
MLADKTLKLCLLVAIALTALPITAAAADSPPNVIFFLSDDHRGGLLGCAGHPILKTPTIDRLAGQGVRFENAFVTTSICAASRATIFTGLYERSHRFTFGTPPIARRLIDRSYPVLLRKAGYRTGFVGKFGVGAEGREEMFDSFVSLGHPYFKRQPDGSLRHLSEIAGDHAIAFLRECPKEKPFCLSVSFNAAHAADGDKINHFPWPKAVDRMYEDLTIPPPKLSDPAVYESQPEFLKKSLNRQRYFWRWDTPEKYQRNVKAYYRMITGLDRVIGRVLDELKELGRDENTVVIFCGDNGYYQASRGFAGKWSHYEESLRVPLVVFDPRAKPDLRGRVLAQKALNVDVAATIVDYAGLDVPESYQGLSLVPLVQDEPSREWRSDFFCEHLMEAGANLPKWEGVRGERYVYARYFQQEPVYEFLHDLKTDPDQLKNLAVDPQHAAALEQARQRCDELRDGYGGPFQPNPRQK